MFSRGSAVVSQILMDLKGVFPVSTLRLNQGSSA